jgi:DtxR family Mn-dependent transcriptional regulator
MVATAELAQELGISTASVSEMLAKLAARSLVLHDPYKGSRLTLRGSSVAVEMVRRHRLLETYLVKALGFRWDQVHDEADRLEHVISSQLEQRIWEVLQHPEVDPHGDPIPGPDGSVKPSASTILSQCAVGAEVRIARVSDRDEEKLKAIAELGLEPGVWVIIHAEPRWEGPLEVDIDGRIVPVPPGLAREIFVDEEAAITAET